MGTLSPFLKVARMTRPFLLSTSTFVCFGATSTKSTAIACAATKTPSAIARDRRAAFLESFMIDTSLNFVARWECAWKKSAERYKAYRQRRAPRLEAITSNRHWDHGDC